MIETKPIVPLKYLAIPVCAVATFAAVQEGHFIRNMTYCCPVWLDNICEMK